MEWYYADGTQQKGPLSAEDFEGLVKAGTIRPETLVWREGMANWLSYRDAMAQTPGPASGGMVCSQCGKTFGPEEVIRYGDAWVCGNCKPAVVQRVREGGPGLAPAAAGTVTPEALLARDYTVDVGDYVSRSWELFKANGGMIVGATILVYLALLAVNLIPYLSMILSLIFTGPLMGGLWLFYLKLNRDEDTSVGDAFQGFGPKFGQLALGNIVPGILAGLCMLPAIGLMMVAFFGFAMRGGNPSLESVPVVLFVVFGILALIGMAGFMFLNVGWIFTLPLIADKGMSFWPAMSLGRRVVNKHWFGTFWLTIVAGLLAMAGILLCGVGILVTGPVAMGMLAAHYQKVFGDLKSGVE